MRPDGSLTVLEELPGVPGPMLERAVLGAGLDLVAGAVYFSLNSQRIGAAVVLPELVSPCGSGSGDGGAAAPADATYPRLLPALELGGLESRVNLNFGTRPFQFAGPPVGADPVPVPDNCLMHLRAAGDNAPPGCWYTEPRAKLRDICTRVAARLASPVGKRLAAAAAAARARGGRGAGPAKAVDPCRCWSRRQMAQQLRDSILLHCTVGWGSGVAGGG